MEQSQIAWIAAFAALGGSFIGALASIVTIAVQSRNEAARHRQELAVKLAQDERNQHIDLAEDGDPIPPLSVYLSYYVALLEEIDKRTLTADKVQELSEDNRKLRTALYELARDSRRATRQGGP